MTSCFFVLDFYMLANMDITFSVAALRLYREAPGDSAAEMTV